VGERQYHRGRLGASLKPRHDDVVPDTLRVDMYDDGDENGEDEVQQHEPPGFRSSPARPLMPSPISEELDLVRQWRGRHST
jgi:hypothetical protein